MSNIYCPGCHQKYDVSDELNGIEVECTRCGITFVVDFANPGTPSDKTAAEANDAQTTAPAADDPTAPREETRLKGKIHRKSANIYEDMADAAFEYLFAAASKIIADEDMLNEKIAETANVIQSSKNEIQSLESSCGSLTVVAIIAALAAIGFFIAGFNESGFFIAGIIGAVIALIVWGSKTSKQNKIKQLRRVIDESEGLQRKLNAEFANLRRDYKIRKLGVVYIPVATQIPFEGKSFMLDDTGHVGKKDFALYRMNNQEEFLAAVARLRQLRENLPMIEQNDNCEEFETSKISPSIDHVHFFDYIGETDRTLRSAAYILNDLSKTSVSLPVIDPHGDYSGFLDNFCADSTGNQPVVHVFPDKVYQAELVQFNELNDMRKKMAKENEKFEQLLRDFIRETAEYIQLTGQMKVMSTGKIIDFSNTMLLIAFRASCNHYSSALEDDEIHRLYEEEFNYHVNASEYEPFTLQLSSQVRFDPISWNWVAEDGSRTNHPLGIHQIQEEVIAPMVRNLLRKNRLERLKVYNNIRDQKLDYLNQWHRDTDDFYGRGRQESSDIINLMQTTLTEFNTALSQYKAFEETEKKHDAEP